MKAGRPRLAVRPCAFCAKVFRPRKSSRRFCSVFCSNRSRIVEPPAPRYAYRGQLSAELQREVAAARAEAPSAPLYRPGASL